MKSTYRRLLGRLACILFVALAGAMSHATAATYSGTVTWVEVWRTGNVAFRLSDPSSANFCNGQFILNVNDAGTKNLFSSVIASKKTGTPISISAGSCGPANNYGGNYIIVDYLYLIQD